MRAIVLGASEDHAKFGNKAVRAFTRAGWEVVPVHPTAGRVDRWEARSSLAALTPGGDVLSIYLPPRVTLGLVDEIARVAPQEVWVNPGADAPEVIAALRAKNLRVRPLCSIVELGFSPAEFP